MALYSNIKEKLKETFFSFIEADYMEKTVVVNQNILKCSYDKNTPT